MIWEVSEERGSNSLVHSQRITSRCLLDMLEWSALNKMRFFISGNEAVLSLIKTRQTQGRGVYCCMAMRLCCDSLRHVILEVWAFPASCLLRTSLPALWRRLLLSLRAMKRYHSLFPLFHFHFHEKEVRRGEHAGQFWKNCRVPWDYFWEDLLDIYTFERLTGWIRILHCRREKYRQSLILCRIFHESCGNKRPVQMHLVAINSRFEEGELHFCHAPSYCRIGETFCESKMMNFWLEGKEGVSTDR